jgi:hypothetical protein
MCVNWARSVLERRSVDDPQHHIDAAVRDGVLLGLMFSGCTDAADSQYGCFKDTHMPHSEEDAASLLTPERIARALDASGVAGPRGDGDGGSGGGDVGGGGGGDVGGGGGGGGDVGGGDRDGDRDVATLPFIGVKVNVMAPPGSPSPGIDARVRVSVALLLRMRMAIVELRSRVSS